MIYINSSKKIQLRKTRIRYALYLVTEPWVPLKILQDYLGVEQYITKDNFQENPGKYL